MPNYALVDSGSTHSVFPMKLGRALGFAYDENAAPKQGEVPGGFVECWSATNSVTLQTEIGPVTFHEVMLLRGGFTYPIVGRHDFFNMFVVTFEERAGEGGEMVFERYDPPPHVN